MKITGSAIKLGIVSLVLALIAVSIVVVFAQMRFNRTNSYTAEFSNGSGLKDGQFVRASGVEVGKVKKVRLIDGGRKVEVDFVVDRSIPLYQSTTAQIRYLNLFADRYLELKRGEGEGADRILPPGGFIPLSRTSPALDLDALIGGFKPLFRALEPEKVNTITSAIVTVFQGQGGTINDILDQTAQLTAHIAERDQAIGEVVKNLNVVLDTTVRHRKEFDQTDRQLRKIDHRAAEPRRTAGRRRREPEQRRRNCRRPPVGESGACCTRRSTTCRRSSNRSSTSVISSAI